MQFDGSKVGFPENVMPASTSTQFGNLLREFRQRVGLSQLQLADYLAISKSNVSKLETGVSYPPQDPQFYDRLRAVPGFSDTDIMLLREAAEVDKSTEVVRSSLAVIEGDKAVLDDSASALLTDFAQKLIDEKVKTHQKIAEAIEKSLKIRASEARRRKPERSSIEVRRQGFLGKQNAQDLPPMDAAKANLDRAILIAQHVADLGAFAASSQKYVLDVIEHMTTIDTELPSELKPLGQMLTEVSTKILTGAYTETLMMLSGLGLEEFTRVPARPTQAAPTTGEEARAPSSKSFTSPFVDDIISALMAPEKVEGGEHLPPSLPDTQQQGDPSATQGRNAPERVLEQPSRRERARKPASQEKDGKRRGVVFESRSQYDREYLQENPEHVAGILVNALINDDSELTPAAEQFLRSTHVFAESVAKRMGASLSQASRDLHIPLPNLSLWVRNGLIPVLYRSRGTTYIANKTVEELGRDYQDAIEMSMQPARLLRERHEKYFPSASK